MKICKVLSVVILSSTLLFASSGEEGSRGVRDGNIKMAKRRFKSPILKILNSLNLNENQKRSLKKIHREKMDRLKAMKPKKRITMDTYYGEENFDKAKFVKNHTLGFVHFQEKRGIIHF